MKLSETGQIEPDVNQNWLILDQLCHEVQSEGRLRLITQTINDVVLNHEPEFRLVATFCP